MNEIFTYLISIAAILAISLACSITRNGFSMKMFLLAVSIGICILVWRNVLPLYTVIIVVLIMVAQWFSVPEQESEKT